MSLQSLLDVRAFSCHENKGLAKIGKIPFPSAFIAYADYWAMIEAAEKFLYPIVMKSIAFPLAALVVLIPALHALAKPPPDPPANRDMDVLGMLIKPQPDESPWREVEWLTDITEARRRAVAEDKPLVIFTAADGSPLGRT